MAERMNLEELFMDECTLCHDCVKHPSDCKIPESARPTAEGLAMDVFATVRSVGYPIEVCQITTRP